MIVSVSVIGAPQHIKCNVLLGTLEHPIVFMHNSTSMKVVQHLKTCEPDAPFFDKNLSVVSNADTWKADRAGVCIGALPVSAGRFSTHTPSPLQYVLPSMWCSQALHDAVSSINYSGDMWAVTLSIGSSPGLSHYAPGTVKLACRVNCA